MRYLVQCSELVFYDMYVEADNEDMARDMVLDGQVDIGQAIDGQDFSVDAITPTECNVERIETEEDKVRFYCRAHDYMFDKESDVCIWYIAN